MRSSVFVEGNDYNAVMTDLLTVDVKDLIKLTEANLDYKITSSE